MSAGWREWKCSQFLNRLLQSIICPASTISGWHVFVLSLGWISTVWPLSLAISPFLLALPAETEQLFTSLWLPRDQCPATLSESVLLHHGKIQPLIHTHIHAHTHPGPCCLWLQIRIQPNIFFKATLFQGIITYYSFSRSVAPQQGACVCVFKSVNMNLFFLPRTLACPPFS